MTIWSKEPLRELATYIGRGKSPVYVERSEYEVLNQACIFPNGLRLENTKYLAPSFWHSLSEEKKLQAGDIVINSTGTGTLGRVGFFHGDEHSRLAYDGHVTVVRPCSENHAKFLFLAFQMPAFQRQIKNFCTTGSTNQVELSREALKDVVIDIPLDKQEQVKIAEVLSTVDEAIAQTEALIAKYGRVRAGLMQDLLTKGIDEEGRIRSEATHTFKDSPLGRIPLEWNLTDLRTVCTRITDGSHQTVKTMPEGQSGIPFLYVSCVRDGRIYWEKAAAISKDVYQTISKGREPRKGLILYTVVGSYGHAALVEDDRSFSFQRHIGYILPNPERADSLFLTNWLNSYWCQKHADAVALGNAQKTVTLTELAEFPVLLPPLAEQQTIANMLKTAEKAIHREEAHRDKLQYLKTGLMQDLLTGNIPIDALLNEATPDTPEVVTP